MTSSRNAVRRGRQEPRVLLRPKYDSEDDALDAIDLIESCGQKLDPFQVTLVCITLASMGGRLSASEVGALIARQNGKGGWLEAIAIWSLFEPYLYGKLDGRKNTTLWTAHELKTSDEAWARVKALIEANPDLAAEVVTWNGGLTGTHIIELRDGSRLIFLARSKSSGRGFSPRRIIFDEAQELSALAFRAMMYATSAQGARRQLIFAGTVPSPENDATIWTGVRDRGRSGVITKLAWAEWSPEGSDDPNATIDPTSWEARSWSNPALGDRILADTIDEEWEAAQADIEGFLRERLSVWPSLESAGSVPHLSDDVQPVALGLSCDLDRRWLSVAGSDGEQCGLVTLGAFADAGGPRVPVGSAAVLIEELVRVNLPVYVQKNGPAWHLAGDLTDSGVRVEPLSFEDVVRAGADLELHPISAPLALRWRTVNGRKVLDDRGGSVAAIALALRGAAGAVNYDPLSSVLL